MTQTNEQLTFIKTIDDFKSFIFESKRKRVLSKEAILNTITILDADLKSNNIKLNINYETYEEIKIFGVKMNFHK